MATYKEIKGVTVQALDADPVEFVGSWASGGTMNTARKDAAGFGAGATNGIVAGGYGGAPAAAGNYVESYNGTSWTETTEVNSGRGWSPAGAGTQTAGVITGGQNLPSGSGYIGLTEEWDGSSWTESGDLNIARAYANMTGSQTAAVAFGGNNPSPTASRTDTENYNGSSWTEANNMNTARDENSLSGRGAPYTSVISVFGTSTEIWDGTNWTESTEVNTPRKSGAGAGESSTSAVIYGGSPHPVAKTESWDGTSWTEVNDLSTGRLDGGTTGGSASNALYAGGNPPYTGVTEEWSFPPPTSAALNEGDIFLSGGTTLKGFAKIGGVPTGAWSSGGNAPAGRYGATGFGTQTDFLMMMGEPFSPGAEQCTYNGTAWAESVNFPGGNNTTLFGAGSSSTLGFVAGGYVGTAGNQTESYDWNGTAWTDASADLNTGRNAGNMNGASVTSTIYGGGSPPSSPPTAGKDQAETWNGTAWTEVSELNRSRYNMAGGGASDSNAFIAGGYGAPPSPNTNIADTEIWNGTSWTEVNNLNTGRSTNSGGGTNTLALVFGGGPTSPGRYAVTELWNGSSWSELADLSIGREYMPSSSNTGTAVKGFASVGLTTLSPAFPTATEEWTVDATLSTITIS